MRRPARLLAVAAGVPRAAGVRLAAGVGRVPRLLAVAALLVVAGAEPAAAHSVGGVKATNYRSEITAISPPLQGVTVRLLEVGRKVELTNDTAEDVVVIGDQNEPYLRVGPSGVFENRRSPTLYQSKAPADSEKLVSLPPEADPRAQPDWRRVSGGRTIRWSDHRVRWSGPDPQSVKDNPGQAQTVVSRWTVPLLHGSSSVVVTGRIAWVPGPAVVPWFLAALVLFAAALVAGASRRWPVLLSSLSALLVASDMVRLYGAATVSGGSEVAAVAKAALFGFLDLAAWVAGIWAIGAIQRRQAVGLYALMAVGIVIGFLSGVGDLLNLAYSQVPTSFPPAAARAAVVLCLGLGFGLVGGAFLALRRLGATLERPVPAAS